MKVSQLKTIIKECLEESIAEVVPQLTSSDPVGAAIKKLKQSYNKFPSFIPDVITYMKSPDDETMFVVIAKQSSTKQYLRLSTALPENSIKQVVDDVKKHYIQQLEKGVSKGGVYALDPHLTKDATEALRVLKSGQPSGDTAMIHKGDLKEMYYFPDLNTQYYAGENLKIPKLSKKYTLHYRRDDGEFYISGYADDADMFDHHAYRIKNKIDLYRSDSMDRGVYTQPKLEGKDLSIINDWSKKPEVQERREFEKKNFIKRNFNK
jgi:hypothetical protein